MQPRRVLSLMLLAVAIVAVAFGVLKYSHHSGTPASGNWVASVNQRALSTGTTNPTKKGNIANTTSSATSSANTNVGSHQTGTASNHTASSKTGSATSNTAGSKRCTTKAANKTRAASHSTSNATRAASHSTSDATSATNATSTTSTTKATSNSTGGAASNSAATTPNGASFTVVVSENKGATVVAKKFLTLHTGENLMQYMQQNFQIQSSYSGGFVTAIDGIKSQWNGVPVSQRQPVDWFLYVNGQQAPVGASSIVPRKGDVDNWDYHRWDPSTGKG